MSDELYRRAAGAFSSCLAFFALFACNAILGADDYHVGQGADGGEQPSSGGSGSDLDAGAGGEAQGSGGARSTGATTGNGGRVTGAGGTTATGTGGRATGGAPAAGGKTATGGSSGAVTAQDFVGEWDSDDETITTDCGDGMPSTQTSADTIQWMLGTGGAIESTFLDTCTLVAKISGRTATISPPVICDDNGLTYSIAGSFTIQADGKASLTEIVMLTTNGTTCTLTGKGVYTKYTPP